MQDLSSPRRSIATSKGTKKLGAPKAKGAVRAKSGCYTCRIRRKKCDEQPNGDGRCQTCVRLRLQCLGFGQKRPEWLKENNNVSVFREKIKDYLAAQGMIKGHSGSGARTSENEGILLLVPDARSDVSSSPTPLSPSSSDDHGPRYNSGLEISAVRDHYSSLPMHTHHSSYTPYTLPELSPDSDRGHSILPNGNDLMLPSYGQPSNILPPPSLVSLSSWHNNQSVYPAVAPSTPSAPASASSSASSYSVVPYAVPMPVNNSLTPSYYQQYTYDDDFDDLSDPSVPVYSVPLGLHANILPHIPDEQNDLVRHYLDHILTGRQYMLADKSILDFIIQTIQCSGAVRDAVCLLATLHRQAIGQNRLSNVPSVSGQGSSADALQTYQRICNTLSPKHAYSEDEALTGLLVVSAFLFDGGRGRWAEFLGVASNWVESVLSRFDDTADFLLRCTDSQRFIIKTTFWFDILASTTKLEPPRFLVYYQRLWGAPSAYIGESRFAPSASQASELSMLTVMGCENATALALAEVSALACWKERQLQMGTLSMVALVERGKAIERNHLAPGSPVVRAAPLDPWATAEAEMALRRRLTSNIFRAAAKVYLHSVVSGDYPNCPEIREGVRETIECLQSMPAVKSTLSSSVLRSVVFGICLCGCLTDDYAERQCILQRLDEESTEAVGNCAEAKRVMQRVWERRDADGKPISWRDAMQELGAESLLLV